jgi:hypothetical protein
MLMGEVHGTVEAPAAFGAAVCHALRQGRAVSVGLELYRDQVEPLAAYLASDGGNPAIAQLLRSSFWTRTAQDGRSSAAMLALVERLRAMRQHYPDLVVFILEDEAGMPSAPAGLARDQTMAARVRAEHGHRPQALILTLSGNVHNRLNVTPSIPGRHAIATPMGVLLTDLSPRSVLLEPSGGTAWVCAPECGVHGGPARGKPPVDLLPVFRELASDEPYTDEWRLGPSTASRPAVHAVAEQAYSGTAP